MDFITGLPKLEGNNIIMAVVDRLTKYACFSALSHPFKESIVVVAFMKIVQGLHGNLKIIWVKWLPFSKWWYNTSFHNS